MSQLDRIERKIDELMYGLGILYRQGVRELANIDEVVAKVEAQTTVIAGVEAFIQSLKDQIAAAGTDPVKLQAIADGLDANTARLSAAVVANT